jgi:choline dehydrogenase-like flavoprotein
MDRAAEVLNLAPDHYDEGLWELIGMAPLAPKLDPKVFNSWFWQFARSRSNHRDILRLGPEFMTFSAPNVRVLLNATVTRINTDETGATFDELEVITMHGDRLRVRAKAAVLAASAIENPRLLLTSASHVHPNGLGNENDLVGRFLMDHPSGTIGHFRAEDAPMILERFGFFGIRHRGRTYIYTHGLVLSKELQRREKLLHCAAYMAQAYASDDPWGALKRLLHGNVEQPISDLAALVSGTKLLVKGLAIRLFESNAVPQQLRNAVVDTIIRLKPNFVVREFQTQGMPHKLNGIIINGITEQVPDPESRITLSDKCDALGVAMARVDWRIDEQALCSLIRLGHLLAAELPRAGFPAPVLENWIVEERPQDSDITDIGHASGTTRMSDDPRRGVVNSKCQVHGVAGLYVAGASVFPTSGHANPTLMIVSLAIRLADQIKIDLTA